MNFINLNKTKIRGGFTLIEILLGLIITGFISAILLDFTRWLVLSSRRAAALLLARDRGERVIAFIEPRILNCAFGFSECRSKILFQRALGKGTTTGRELSFLTNWSYWPIVVYINERGNLAEESSDGVFRGKSFAVVYSRPSGLAVKTLNPEKNFLSPNESVEFTVFRGNIDRTNFKDSVNYTDLRSWCVFPSVGVPFHIDSISGKKFYLKLLDSWENSVNIPPICEVYELAADRFYIVEIDSEFRFQEMQISFYPTSGYPRENGVLAMYVEWRPDEKIFDLYVLTSGGNAVLNKSSRPFEWPVEAEWKSEFEKHELYVSRASWKIRNL